MLELRIQAIYEEKLMESVKFKNITGDGAEKKRGGGTPGLVGAYTKIKPSFRISPTFQHYTN